MVNVGGCAAGDIQFLGPDLDRQFQHRRRLVDEQRTMLARVGIPCSVSKAEVSLPKLISDAGVPAVLGYSKFANHRHAQRTNFENKTQLHRRHCGEALLPV